jgi:hypothetical protein
MKQQLIQRCVLAGAYLTIAALAPDVFGQGALTPPGAPAPTMKTLTQVEPRTPISSLPFVIGAPGSYYLVTNLTSLAGTDGITVLANHVTIDLCGFALDGGGGGWRGIVAGGKVGLRVCNGSIINWTSAGVMVTNIPVGGFISVDCQCERLRLTGNGGGGLLLGGGSSVIACMAVSNGFAGGGYGIQVSGQSSVKDCVAMQNTSGGGFASFGPGSVFVGCSSGSNSTGFFLGGGGRITDCAASFNSGQGIMTGPGCSVVGCTAFYNGTDGIFVPDGGTVKDCTAKWNGGNGIVVVTNCYVFGNTCDANTAAGIRAMIGANRIESNSTTGNAAGIDCGFSSADLVIRNSARSNGINYLLNPAPFPIGTENATIFPVVGAGFFNGDPWGNFSY